MSPDAIPMGDGGGPPGIDHYTHLRFVTRGGTASVYRAIDPTTGSPVAIKVIDAAEPGRAQREMDALRRLTGTPGLLPLLGHGRLDDGRSYLVTPFLARGSVAARLASQGRFDAPEVIAIGQEVGRALAAAHQQGVLHRDIKPSNILIDDDGRHVLIDFGTARTILADLTTGQTFSLTVIYSAPELIDGARGDQRADVYSLGLTLHALLTGAHPFQPAADTSLVRLVNEIAATPLPDLRQLGVANDLAAVIERATAKDPDLRYQSAAEFVAALDRLDPTAPPDRPRRRRIGPFSPRRRRLAVAGLVAAVLAVGGVALERADATGHGGRAMTAPAPGSMARPTIVERSSRRFHASGAFHARRAGYLEIASFIPADTFSLCLPSPLIDQFEPGRTMCTTRYRGDGHAFSGHTRIDPSANRVYIRIDFRTSSVVATQHASCQVYARDDPDRCDPLNAPIIENDVPYSNRFRPDWESCADEHFKQLIATDLPGCLTLAGQWFFPDDNVPARPYVNVQEHLVQGRHSLRLIWYGPLTDPAAGVPRALSDGEIEFEADGTLHVRRDCWPDLQIDWVDRHGVHQVFSGSETNKLPSGYPVELNAARDKECVATGRW